MSPPLPNPIPPPVAISKNQPQDIVVLDGSFIPEPALPNPDSEEKLQHPHSGGKQPKQLKPPKCISIDSMRREEKNIG